MSEVKPTIVGNPGSGNWRLLSYMYREAERDGWMLALSLLFPCHGVQDLSPWRRTMLPKCRGALPTPVKLIWRIPHRFVERLVCQSFWSLSSGPSGLTCQWVVISSHFIFWGMQGGYSRVCASASDGKSPRTV